MSDITIGEYEKIVEQYEDVLKRKAYRLEKLAGKLNSEIKPFVLLPRKTFWIIQGKIFWSSENVSPSIFEDESPIDHSRSYNLWEAILKSCGCRPSCIVAASRALDEAIRWFEEQIALREKEAQRILDEDLEFVREMEAEIAMEKLAER